MDGPPDTGNTGDLPENASGNGPRFTEHHQRIGRTDPRVIAPANQLIMEHSPEREWFMNIGRLQTLDLIIDDIKETYPDPNEVPDELREFVSRCINTAIELNEVVFDPDQDLPDGVAWRVV